MSGDQVADVDLALNLGSVSTQDNVTRGPNGGIVGRPKKYAAKEYTAPMVRELCENLEGVINKMCQKDIFRYIDEDSLCFHLGLSSRRQLEKIREANPEFSEMLSRWQVKRNYLWSIVREDPKIVNPIRAIFLDKNLKGLKDKADDGGVSVSVNIQTNFGKGSVK